MDSINWDALGALGDLLGSIGVSISLVSLVYLACQARQGAAETRGASIHPVMELAIQFRSES